MEILLVIVAAVVLLIVVGKLKGPPSPKDMSDEAILGRLNSENAWIRRYQSLPSEHRGGLQQQHDDKQRYIMELMLELQSRHGDKEQESLAPVMQKTLELMRQGVPEAKAKETAMADFLAARERKQATTKEGV